MHLFNLVDMDSLQPLSDVPDGGQIHCPMKRGTTAAVWHPIEELNSFAYLLEDETDRSLGVAQRIALPPAQQFRADASEGFQGCFQVFFGRAKMLGGRHLEQHDWMARKALARVHRHLQAG